MRPLREQRHEEEERIMEKGQDCEATVVRDRQHGLSLRCDTKDQDDSLVVYLQRTC